MITFLAIPRAFTGEFDVLQRRAIQSWQTCAPGCQIVLFGDEPGIKEMAVNTDIWHRPLAYSATGAPLVDSVYSWGNEFALHEWVCFCSADIVFDADFAAVLRALSDIERPFVIGQRRDVDGGGFTLHAPCGVDYFLYRRGTIGPVLPFTVRGGGGDNWMVHKALTDWQMAVIDATATITAWHYPHGHPEWPTGKAGRQGSVEQRHNHALAQADGMNAAPGIDSAPYVLVGNRFLHKSEVAAA